MLIFQKWATGYCLIGLLFAFIWWARQENKSLRDQSISIIAIIIFWPLMAKAAIKRISNNGR